MSPKRTERATPARAPRKKSARKQETPPTPDPFADYPTFPLTLRNLRLGIAGRLGKPYSQQKFSEIVKVSRTHLTNIETGRVNASQFLLLRIAEKLKIDLEIVRTAYAGSKAKLDRDPKTGKKKAL